MNQQSPFRIRMLNNVITVFTFDNLYTDTIRMWGSYALKFKGQPMPDPLRLLYDLTAVTDPPSRYLFTYQNDVIAQLNFPQNFRDAFVIPDMGYDIWLQVAARTRTKLTSTYRVFTQTQWDEAVGWLMDGL